MRRPYALIYDALPDYSEQDVASGIQAALVGQKRAVTLQAMIDAVEAHCRAAQTAYVEEILAKAQETARRMPSTIEWKAKQETAQQELRRIEREAACLLIARVEAIVDRVTEQAATHMAAHRAGYERFERVTQRLGLA